MTLLWRLVLILLALFLGWRALALGLSNHYANRSGPDQAEVARAALAWDSDQAVASSKLASVAAREGNPALARELWQKVLRGDPGNAAALLGLALITDNREQASALVQRAVALNPANPTALKRAAAYWLEHDEPEKAVGALSSAMLADPNEGEALFPVYLKLFDDARTRHLITPYAERPPAWWDAFFQAVAATASDTESLRALYSLRRSPTASPLSAAEREAYVERLRKDGRTTEAYLTWVNGLDAPQRRALGLVNNGGFEIEPTGIGWDWRIRGNDNLYIETAQTYAAEGRRALHLVFRGYDREFANVWQELFLEPGSYRLTGQVRPSGLKTSGGLQWAIDCTMSDRRTRLATSNLFAGSAQWEPFELDFDVPPDCTQPILRLVGADRVASDRRIEGSIWFDAMRIQRKAAASTIQ